MVNNVIERNNKRRQEAIWQLAFLIPNGVASDAMTVLLNILDEYEAEIEKLSKAIEEGGSFNDDGSF